MAYNVDAAKMIKRAEAAPGPPLDVDLRHRYEYAMPPILSETDTAYSG